MNTQIKSFEDPVWLLPSRNPKFGFQTPVAISQADEINPWQYSQLLIRSTAKAVFSEYNNVNSKWKRICIVWTICRKRMHFWTLQCRRLKIHRPLLLECVGSMLSRLIEYHSFNESRWSSKAILRECSVVWMANQPVWIAIDPVTMLTSSLSPSVGESQAEW